MKYMSLMVVILTVAFGYVLTPPDASYSNIQNNGIVADYPTPKTSNHLLEMSHIRPECTDFRYDSTGLDSLVRDRMATAHLPGVATWCSKNGQVIWEQYYGYARFAIPDSILVTDTTVFTLMSISKTVTGTAIMQLWERGVFGLDEDINDYLDFEVHNPNHPDSVITFRMLMTHTSSVADNDAVLAPLWVPNHDSPVPLDSFLREYLTPGGAYYSTANFTNSIPGADYEYSSVGVAVLGYLVQVMEDSFPVHCQDSIFNPLDMNETSWFLSELDTTNIVKGYHWNGTSYDPVPYWCCPHYPANQLRTSARHLAQHLLAIAQFGMVDTVRILDSTTVELITSLQHQLSPNQWLGLLWTYFNTGTRWVWAHDGASDGVSTVYAFCPEENSAVIVLTNGESFWNGTYVIMNALFDYALQYAVEERTSTSIASQHILPTVFHGPLILPESTKCKIFDITGRMVKLESMKPGIYFIEIDGVVTQKVVKVR